jgi:hypothetical protein
MFMGDIINFPSPPEADMMPGHAVDLRRIIQIIRYLVKIHGSDTEKMWSEFDEEMVRRVGGYDGYDVEPRELGKMVSIMTATDVGACQFTVFVFNGLLRKT